MPRMLKPINACTEQAVVLDSLLVVCNQRLSRCCDCDMVYRNNQQARAIQDSLDLVKQAEEIERRYEEIQNELDRLSAKIYFVANQAVVRDYSSNELNSIVKILKDYPELRIKAVGYRNSDDTMYLTLSKERAVVVKNMLVRQGVDPNRIIVRDGGLSTRYPRESLLDSHGNQYTLNMRVELKIIR